jgi:RNA polymerase sigma-70 factor (sigma-E family)
LGVTFEDFVAARMSALVRYATVVTWDVHLAEDITQTVLVRAAARWSSIERLDSPEHYVKRMIINEFLSWRRRRAARAVPLDLVTPPAVPDATAACDERDAMLRLIAELPPRQRAAVALRYYEDLPIAEIANLLGSRETAVRTNLSRAIATLRRRIADPAPSLQSTGDAT